MRSSVSFTIVGVEKNGVETPRIDAIEPLEQGV